MNILSPYISQNILNATGWTIVHSLWQGMLVVLLLALMLRFIKKFSAKIRYTLGVFALLLVFLVSLITFYGLMAENSVERPVKSPETLTIAGNGSAANINTFTLKQDKSGGIVAGTLFSLETFFRDNLPIVVVLWLMGFLVQMLRFVGGYAHNQRLKVHGTRPIPEQWQARTRKLCDRMGIKKRVRVLESSLIKIPLVIGFIKPVVLVPIGMIVNMPAHQVEALLLHEFAHIVRKDYLVNLLQSLVEMIFFFHPGVWWISSVIRCERERCCDDLALAAAANSMELARALTSLNERGVKVKKWALALTNKKNQALERIKRLFQNPRVKINLGEGVMVTAVLLVGFLLTLSLSAGISSEKAAEEMTARQLIENMKAGDFKGEKISFAAKNEDLQQVIKSLLEKQNLKVKFDKTVEGKVTFNWNHGPWDQLLDYFLEVNDLQMSEQDDCLLVNKIAGEKVSRKALERLHKKRDYIGQPEDFSYQNVKMVEILILYAEKYNLNVAVDPGISFGAVTCGMKGVPWDKALELMLEKQGLTMNLKGKLLRISKKPSAMTLTAGQLMLNLKERKFTGEAVNMEFMQVDLATVLEAIASMAHLPIHVDPAVKGKVTLELKDVPYDQFLDYVLDVNDLEIVLEKERLRIKKARGKWKKIQPQLQEKIYVGRLSNFSFARKKLGEILFLFAETSKYNIIVDPGCPMKKEITFSIERVPWDKALDMICMQVGLVMELKDNLIRIRKL